MSRGSLLRRTGRVALGVAGVGTVGLAAGMIEARCPVIRRFEVPILKAGHRPIRLLHISDLHLLPFDRGRINFVRSLAGLEPDLVVSTGDNMADVDSVEAVVEAYEPLFDKPGVFVFGSNDYYASTLKSPLSYFVSWGRHEPTVRLPAAELARSLTEYGWANLNNQRTTFELGGQVVEFRGTNDAHMDADHYEAVAGPASAGVDLSLGVTHAPYLELLDAMTNDAVSLILAGHTHGGQVCLPVKGALITNCDLDTARAKGLHRHHTPLASSWLHVSAGLGTSPFAPYRLFCRPEVSLLTLTPGG